MERAAHDVRFHSDVFPHHRLSLYQLTFLAVGSVTTPNQS